MFCRRSCRNTRSTYLRGLIEKIKWLRPISVDHIGDDWEPGGDGGHERVHYIAQGERGERFDARLEDVVLRVRERVGRHAEGAVADGVQGEALECTTADYKVLLPWALEPKTKTLTLLPPEKWASSWWRRPESPPRASLCGRPFRRPPRGRARTCLRSGKAHLTVVDHGIKFARKTSIARSFLNGYCSSSHKIPESSDTTFRCFCVPANSSGLAKAPGQAHLWSFQRWTLDSRLSSSSSIFRTDHPRATHAGDKRNGKKMH